MTLKKASNTLSKPLKELSIQVSLSGLSFCVSDSVQEKVIQLGEQYFEFPAHAESLVEPLNRLLQDEDLFPERFGNVKVIHENELSSFVPKALFNESNLPDYLKYNVKILENDFISYDEISNRELFNVYIPFTNVNNFLYDRFGSFEYKHASTVMLETLFQKLDLTRSEEAFAEIQENHFKLFIFRDGKLLFYNYFQYTNAEDFLYFTLFAYEQLGLKASQCRLTLLGLVDQESELFQMAYTYIQEVEAGNSRFLNQPRLSDLEFMNPEKHFTLLNGF